MVLDNIVDDDYSDIAGGAIEQVAAERQAKKKEK
jgi:hypothetical protein